MAKIAQSFNFQFVIRIDPAVIKSATSAASLVLQGSPPSPAVRMLSRRPWAPLQIQGGCASSRLDHGLNASACKPSGEAALSSS